MEKAVGRVVRSEEEWKAIIEAQERSHRSAAGFCREHDIVYGHFLYHRRKLHRNGDDVLAIARSAGIMPAARPGGFIPIKIEGCHGLRLRFPMGLVLESDQLLSAAWVVDVARRWTGEGVAPC